VNELLLTIRLQIVGVEDGGDSYIRASSKALGHQWTLQLKPCSVFHYGR